MTNLDGFFAGLTVSLGFFATMLAIYSLMSPSPWLTIIPVGMVLFFSFLIASYSQLSIRGVAVAFAIGSLMGLGLMYESQVSPMHWMPHGN